MLDASPLEPPCAEIRTWRWQLPGHAAPLAARAERLADRAVSALIAEALLTPKPALVDQRGCGAHHDLDLQRLLRSAAALRESFRNMALQAGAAAPDVKLREKLGAFGRQAEACMLAATGGSNAHRGAIWVLGLLVAGLALSRPGAAVSEIAAIAAALANLPDRHAPRLPSNGSAACRRYGVRGARGEACAGFPHVLGLGLPSLQRARARGADETCARLDALMAIMSSLADTCLLHRGGWAAVTAARHGARRVLTLGGSATAGGRQALLALDGELLRLHASPGGCADLLAACLLLDDLQSQPL
jgi:triphosphoribosyl-dephospho-CoA synthase